jgi:hypothetical protein
MVDEVRSRWGRRHSASVVFGYDDLEEPVDRRGDVWIGAPALSLARHRAATTSVEAPVIATHWAKSIPRRRQRAAKPERTLTVARWWDDG